MEQFFDGGPIAHQHERIATVKVREPLYTATEDRIGGMIAAEDVNTEPHEV